MSRDKKFDLFILLTCLLLALALRLPGLTVFLTADEARSWFGRSIIFLDSLARADFANTGPGGEVAYIENVSIGPAPGVTTMWAGALGILFEYWRQGAPLPLIEFLHKLPFDPLDPAMLFWLRLPGVLVAAAVVGLTYWWGRSLLGRWGAWLAAGLLALDPFYLALSRVLGHDALVASMMWLSLLAFWRATYQSNNSDARFTIFSGFLAGLAFLSKYPALFIGVFIVAYHVMRVMYQTWRLRTSPFTLYALRAMFWPVILWSIAAEVTFIVFWPAMWVHPLDTVTVIFNDALRASGSSHPKGSFFLSQPVPDPGLWFYPLVAWLRTTPVVAVGVVLSLGQFVREVMRRLQKQEPAPDLLLSTFYLWAYVILYSLLVTYGGKKQDRYLLPAFPAMTMLAAMGYTYVVRYVLNSSRFTYYTLRFALHASPVALLIFQLFLVYPTHPYYFSYYNPLAGGATAAARLIQVGWGEGLDQAAAYLNTLPGAESAKVTSWYSTTFEPYFKGHAIYKIDEDKISRSAKPGLAADYVVFYINQTQRRLPSEGVLQFFQTTTPVYTVTLNGLDYAWIYRAPAVTHIIRREARLVGQAELLGYTLTDEAGQPVTTAYPESVVNLSLYWEWQGKAENEPIRVSLVDKNGKTRGWGNSVQTVAPLPYAAWQDGMTVRDDLALVIFPDTPPGEYRLTVWIERPSSGETVGVFPLEDEVIIPVVPR
jgi:hypothetical protein